MRKDDYRIWLSKKIENKPVIDYISRCERVEESLKIDLDDEFKKDRGKELLNLLSYTKQDFMDNRPPKCTIKFSKDANLYNGLSSLRTAIRKYFNFCNK